MEPVQIFDAAEEIVTTGYLEKDGKTWLITSVWSVSCRATSVKYWRPLPSPPSAYIRAKEERARLEQIRGAAPELLVELITVRDNLLMMVSEGILEYYDFTGIDAAIAKAKGEQSAPQDHDRPPRHPAWRLGG
jgi:hypothetical protein